MIPVRQSIEGMASMRVANTRLMSMSGKKTMKDDNVIGMVNGDDDENVSIIVVLGYGGSWKET